MDDEGDAGLPPSAARIVSPYDPAARYSRRGQVTRWAGYLAHVTETCAGDGPNVITDVATMPATHGPCPTSSPGAVPLVVARFTKAQCQPCPVRPPAPPPATASAPWASPARALRAAGP